jgi:hypothetical protein
MSIKPSHNRHFYIHWQFIDMVSGLLVTYESNPTFSGDRSKHRTAPHRMPVRAITI